MVELLERSPLSATELRILLAVLDREAAASELARSLDRRPRQIRYAAERLYARGLLHWRHDRRRNEPMLALTATGLAALRPLLAPEDPLLRPWCSLDAAPIGGFTPCHAPSPRDTIGA